MIEKQCVSIEVAKLLKQKNFDEFCRQYVDINDIEHNSYCNNNHESRVAIPEIWQVVEWLRIEKNLFIKVDFAENNFGYYFNVLDLNQMKRSEDIYGFNTPKESYEQAILYISRYLI